MELLTGHKGPDKWQQLLRVRWELASRDPLEFFRWFCYTCDTHDKTNPIKPFPWHKPHVQYMARLWQNNPLLVIRKSRQMIQTWEFCALSLWDALFNPGRLICLQSKKEEDAIGDETSGDGLLGRVKFMLNHVPGRELLLPKRNYRPMEKSVKFFTRSSTILAIAQGADIIRSHTISGLLSDECGFQDKFHEAYMAAIPCIRGGGWFVALSTANPGFYKALWYDDIASYN